MCLIIRKPANVQIPHWIIESALKSNPDGFGISCNGKRERFAYASDMRAIARLNRPDELLVHFRWATAGVVNKGNVHPFALSDGSLLMHNGILPKKYQPKAGLKAGENDTRIFIRTYLEPAIKQGAWPTLAEVEKEIASDKLAVMRADASITLYNAPDWVQWEGLDLSNTYAWDAPDALCPERTFRGKWLPAKYSKWYDERGARNAYDDANGAIAAAYDAGDTFQRIYGDNERPDYDADVGADLWERVTNAILEREDDVDWKAALYAVDLADAPLVDGILDGTASAYDFCRHASADALLFIFADLAEKRCV